MNALKQKMDKILALQEEMKQAEKEYEKELEKEEYWHLTKSTLTIPCRELGSEKLSIECNYESYQYCKDHGFEHIFYLEIKEDGMLSYPSVALNIEDAEMLLIYLERAVNFYKK